MKQVMWLARGIDGLNQSIGRMVIWLVLLSVLVSSGNALMRYQFDISSNAWLELQWYFFALIFLFGAGYTLRHNGHVRIDVLYGRFSKRTQAWIDLAGGLLFLLPMAILIAWMGWNSFEASYAILESSPDAGGLPRWPIKLAVPLGFALLALQGVSEVIKRVAFLTGQCELGEEQREEVV